MKVFSKSYLAEFFILILGLILGWSLWHQHQQKLAIDALTENLELINEEQAKRNQNLTENIKAEVKDQIVNEGNRANTGLLDTTDLILEMRREILDSEYLNFDKTLHYQLWNGDLYNQLVHHEYEWDQVFIQSLPKPTGGYQEIPYKGEYKVIQNCK